MAYPEELPHNPYQRNTLGIDLNTLPLKQQLEIHRRRLRVLYELPDIVDMGTISTQTLEIWCQDIRETVRALDGIRSNDVTRAKTLLIIIKQTRQAQDALTIGKEALKQEKPMKARKTLIKQMRDCQSCLDEALNYFKAII